MQTKTENIVALRIGDNTMPWRPEHERLVFLNQVTGDIHVHTIGIPVEVLQGYSELHPGKDVPSITYAGHTYPSLTTLKEVAGGQVLKVIEKRLRKLFLETDPDIEGVHWISEKVGFVV